MTYELAKQLKDAGFPQRLHDIDSHDWIGENYVDDPTDYILSPTLSELIEACGENFEELVKMNIGWEAHGATDNTHSGIEGGSTPEEAVAKLWLSLNKRD